MPYITSVERIGKEEGLQQGRLQGLQQGMIESIEIILKNRFGPGNKGILEEIRSLGDTEKLRAILQMIETVKSPEELRKLWV